MQTQRLCSPRQPATRALPEERKGTNAITPNARGGALPNHEPAARGNPPLTPSPGAVLREARSPRPELPRVGQPRSTPPGPAQPCPHPGAARVLPARTRSRSASPPPQLASRLRRPCVPARLGRCGTAATAARIRAGGGDRCGSGRRPRSAGTHRPRYRRQRGLAGGKELKPSGRLGAPRRFLVGGRTGGAGPAAAPRPVGPRETRTRRPGSPASPTSRYAALPGREPPRLRQRPPQRCPRRSSGSPQKERCRRPPDRRQRPPRRLNAIAGGGGGRGTDTAPRAHPRRQRGGGEPPRPAAAALPPAARLPGTALRRAAPARPPAAGRAPNRRRRPPAAPRPAAAG